MHDLTKEDIRIGTLISYPEIERFKKYPFESFNLVFDLKLTDQIPELAKRVMESLDGTGIVVSTVQCTNNLFNPGEEGQLALKQWETMIDNIHLFGSDLVCGFTGKLAGASIERNLELYKKFFSPLSKRAKDRGVRIAFENCGKAHADNIATNPTMWNRMYELVPEDNIGLQWEPAHQTRQLIDAVAQLRLWAPKVFHLHGKDVVIHWDIIEKYGINGGVEYAFDRIPGFGKCNWTEIISILRANGFTGSIDIEGFHDPVYNGKLEMTAQLHSLNYLIDARGGYFVSE